MAKPQDILLESDFDVSAKNGDFIVADATLQHQQLLLLSDKGDWKASPEVAVGLRTFLLDDMPVDELHQEIQKQFALDGMKVKTIVGTSWEDTIINSDYE